MMLARSTLRIRLAFASAGAVLLVSALFGFLQFRIFSTAAVDQVDDELTQALNTRQRLAGLAGDLRLPQLSDVLAEAALADKPEIETWCIGCAETDTVPVMPPDLRNAPSGHDVTFGGTWLGREFRFRARRVGDAVFVAGRAFDSFVASERRFVWFLVTQGLLMALVAAFLGYLVTRQAMQPVRRLVGTAQAIADTGDLAKRVHEGGSDRDLANLASTFNEMLNRIESAYHKIAASLAAERRFVADASHELRTPLTTIQGNVDYLGRIGDDTVADAEALDDIRASVERLTTLVAHLSELAREDAGVREHSDLIDFDEMIRDIAQEPAYQPVVIDLDLENDLWVRGSEPSLAMVVRNLLGNAVKYGNGRISVAAHRRGNDVVLDVRDDGPGVAGKDVPYVFERFWRADTTKGREGSGLGLSIVKAAVEAHGGRVVAYPGPGGHFEVVVPASGPSGSSALPEHAELDADGSDAQET